jgi:hypothetical protein
LDFTWRDLLLELCVLLNRLFEEAHWAADNEKRTFKLFVLEFAFTFACLAFGRQALTLLNR